MMANKGFHLTVSVQFGDVGQVFVVGGGFSPSACVRHTLKRIWCREVLAVSQYRSSVSSVRNTRAES